MQCTYMHGYGIKNTKKNEVCFTIYCSSFILTFFPRFFLCRVVVCLFILLINYPLLCGTEPTFYAQLIAKMSTLLSLFSLFFFSSLWIYYATLHICTSCTWMQFMHYHHKLDAFFPLIWWVINLQFHANYDIFQFNTFSIFIIFFLCKCMNIQIKKNLPRKCHCICDTTVFIIILTHIRVIW